MINDEQFEALSVAFVSCIALTQSSKEPELTSVKLKEMLSKLLPEDMNMNIDSLYDRLRSHNAGVLDSNDEYNVEVRRQLWATDYNLKTWHESWEKFLVAIGLGSCSRTTLAWCLSVSKHPELHARSARDRSELWTFPVRCSCGAADHFPKGRQSE